MCIEELTDTKETMECLKALFVAKEKKNLRRDFRIDQQLIQFL